MAVRVMDYHPNTSSKIKLKLHQTQTNQVESGNEHVV